ncbi:DUF3267 domain-containing protein [Desulfosporosinus orientis]|uniref:DUF3267 domain-containing protein n=1 Tax=Desulfosporosinus orientis TaxID=1563 RepID=UPI001930AD36|nr:DUF3267 domain-containing protein [Desulfosporosinus orientis]
MSSISFEEFGLNASSISISINLFHVVGIFLLLLIHEFIHLSLIPSFIKSEKTFFGINPCYGFVYSEELISKNRYIIITLAPFVIISVILPVIGGLMGLLNPFAKFLILFNAMASSVDILNFILVAKQTPSKSYLTSNGQYTFWTSKSATKPDCR